jgi:hypothetical protein
MKTVQRLNCEAGLMCAHIFLAIFIWRIKVLSVVDEYFKGLQISECIYFSPSHRSVGFAGNLFRN